MATKKASKGIGAIKRTTPAFSSKNPKSPAHPLYGRPILEAVQRGDLAEMKRVRTQALKHIKEVNAALAKLDAKLQRG